MTSFGSDQNLVLLLENFQWETAKQRILADPESIFGRTRRNVTPLHALCQLIKYDRNVNMDEISLEDDSFEDEFSDEELEENFMEGYEHPSQEDAVAQDAILALADLIIHTSHTQFRERPSVLTLIDSFEKPPLAYALEPSSANLDMLKLVVKHCNLPESPVTFAQPMSQKAYVSRVVTLLHVISESRLPFSAQKFVLEAVPDNQLVDLVYDNVDVDLESALHWAMGEEIHSTRRLELYLRSQGSERLLLQANVQGKTPLMTFAERLSSDEVYTLNERVFFCRNVLRAISRRVYQDEPPCSLHMISSMAHVVPLEILDFIMEHDDGRLDISFVDSHGRLPVHTASMVESETDHLTANLLFLQVKYPQGLQVACQKHQRLPLHYALHAGRSKHVVDLMVNFFPKSVTVVDPVTGLLPFLLGAFCSSVEATYSVLRADPGVIRRLLYRT